MEKEKRLARVWHEGRRRVLCSMVKSRGVNEQEVAEAEEGRKRMIRDDLL